MIAREFWKRDRHQGGTSRSECGSAFNDHRERRPMPALALFSVALMILSFCPLSFGQETQPPKAGRRTALLIGNSQYLVLPPLRFISDGLQKLAIALKKTGFEVTILENLNADGLDKISEFKGKLEPGDIFLFYFGGYAVQAGGDWLLPTDFDPSHSRNADWVLSDWAYPLRKLQDFAEERHVGLKIVLLDASWNVDVTPVEITGPGLAYQLGESKETFFASGAQPGQVVGAPSGNGIGLFTKSLAKNGVTPGLSLSELCTTILKEVSESSRGRQQPYCLPSVTQPFYFVAPDPPLGVPFNNPKDHEDYLWIPPGTFKMGCVSVPDAKCESHEKPQHSVTLSRGLWIGKNEVEVTAYQRFVGSDKKNRKMPEAPIWDKKRARNKDPITSASWEDARAYCEWAGGRLPTEAEWEYAARSGEPDQVYPLNSENSRDKANFEGMAGNDIFGETAPVCSFDPSPKFKLCDMAGNVWEWVNDWYSATYYEVSPKIDPQGPSVGKEHVVRGGSFDSTAKEHLRISYRKPVGKKSANNIGFRCVLDDTPETRKLLKFNE